MKLMFFLVLIFFSACSTQSKKIEYFTLEELIKITNVNELKPTEVLRLAASMPVLANQCNGDDLFKKGIDLRSTGIIYYDMSKILLNEDEIILLENFLEIKTPCFQIVNPNASLCNFSRSFVGLESLLFLSWKEDKPGEFCIKKGYIQNFEKMKEYYLSN